MIYYDEVKNFIELLPTPNGFNAGLPLRLSSWQDKILYDIFSTDERPEIIYIEIPRKNGKTTFISGLLISLFSLDPEKGAEFYCCSGDKEQAGIIYTISDYMVTNTSLKKRIRSIPSQKKFVSRKDRTRLFRSLSADAHSKHGYNPYVTIFDEFHVFKNRDLWDVMDTGDIARKNPMKIIITTAGNDMSSLCGEFHDYTEEIQKGRIVDDQFKGYIYTVEDKKKWKDEEQWIIANPSLQDGILDIERLRRKFKRALGKPKAEKAFKRLHLNIWESSYYSWVEIDDINNISTDFKQGFGGLDLGFGADTTSLALVKKENNKILFKTYIWITEAEARRMEDLHDVPYYEWKKQGYVRSYGEEIADYEILENDIRSICKQHGISAIGYDRWKSHQLIGRLNRNFEMVPIGQGFKTMTMPIKLFEDSVKSKLVYGHHNPATEYAFKCAYIKEDAAGNAKPDKQKSWHKIDPVVSILIGLVLAETRQPKKTSIYEKRGV